MTNRPREGVELTVAGLVGLVPEALVPLVPAEAPDTPVDGVHISELADPTTYLHGGELLLTTGLSVPLTGPGCRSYVSRLVDAGVVGLGFGLGPVHHEVPAVLERACRRQGLPLLVVPDEVPFQAVTRAFWEGVEAVHERSLHAAIDSHRRLVAAAASDDPVPGVLEVLARAVDGWAVLTDASGRATATWPTERAGDAAAIADDVRRMRPAGGRSAASFPLGGDVASLHPVVGDGETLGYLATVSASALSSERRGVLLSSLALLGADAAHRRHSRVAARSGPSAVARLVRAGHLRAAHDLADSLGIPGPSAQVRLVVAGGGAAERAAVVLGDVLDGSGVTWWGATTGRVAWALVHRADDWPDSVSRELALGRHAQGCAIGIGPLTRLSEVGRALPLLEAWCTTLPPHGVHEWQQEVVPFASTAWAGEVLAPLLRHAPDLVPVVAAYLRNRGRWEQAAEETGMHRNSVRARIARAEELLGGDLTDPDHAARVWLALRASGVDSVATTR